MPATIETTDTEVVVRLPVGGSWVVTDEIGTELFRVTSAGDAVKVKGVAFDPATLDELATLGGLTATATELNYNDITTLGTAQASKTVTANSNIDVTALRNVTATGVVTAPNFDAGASGTAGTVDVFPTTAAKGKLAISVTDQDTNATVSLVVGAMALARTVTLADPLGNADILTGKMAAVARTASADGLTTGTIADAGMIQYVEVTSANVDHIVVLPTPTPGRIVILNNGATGYELRSSAPASVSINGGAEADAESAIAANSTIWAICVSATAWKAFFMDADSDLAKVQVAAAA